MDDRERDLEEVTAELSETLEALRSELREPPRGALGLPRPPRPSELLRFTEQYTIPTVIALLEASIRALELLAAALRVADGRPLDAATERSDRPSGVASIEGISQAGRDRLARTSRDTLQRLDDALAELQSAAEGDPSNPELRRLLEEARALRSEVDDRLADATSESDPPASVRRDNRDSPDESSTDSPGDEDGGVGIDVDEELASIKDDLDAERAGAGDDGENGSKEDRPE
jgi:hypothetical protein